MNTNKIIILSLAVLLSAGLTVQAQTEIRTVEEMTAIGKDKKSREGSYILMNDLTLDNWTPIDFSGTFNGNGHTIALSIDRSNIDSKMKAAASPTNIGLFAIVNRKAAVANLHITGGITCKSNHFTLAAGGIAGLNQGKIVNCISSANIKAEGVDQIKMMVVGVTTGGGTSSVKVNDKVNVTVSSSSHTSTAVNPYDQCTLAGGIAGINYGQIANCYASGNIEVSGNGHRIGGGIAGGNGVTHIRDASISRCYTTVVITVRDDGKSRIAGGIVGRNMGELTHCAALNNKIDVFGKTTSDRYEKNFVNVNTLFGESWNNGGSQNGFYLASMGIHVENPDDRELNPDGAAVELSVTQQQTWWENSPRFAFGQTNDTPWIWDETLKRPILFWEKFDVATMQRPTLYWEKIDVATMLEQTKVNRQIEMYGNATPDINWRIENDTLFVTGNGDLPGNPSWTRAFSEFSGAIIDDRITSLGHHAFAMAKITSVVIGKSVKSLNTYAFFMCKNLTTVEVRNPVPPKVGSFVFMSTPICKAKLIVPAGSKDAYIKNKDWKKFGIIEER